MSKWTYSRYKNGYGHELPPEVRFNGDPDESELLEIAQACAEDDHYNHDGWEGAHTERTINLFCDEKLHSSYTVTVEYTPQFTAERATQAAKKPDPPEHDLYETSDADKPEVICDRNGEVVLGLCKKCGRGEAELSEPCVPRQKGGA